jgi:hypothetical protein
MNRYLLIVVSAFIIEIASTMYISTVSDNSPWMLFWAFVGPFLGLPFIGSLIDAESWPERIKIAFSSAVGYLIGAAFVYLQIFEK